MRNTEIKSTLYPAPPGAPDPQATEDHPNKMPVITAKHHGAFSGKEPIREPASIVISQREQG